MAPHVGTLLQNLCPRSCKATRTPTPTRWEVKGTGFHLGDLCPRSCKGHPRPRFKVRGRVRPAVGSALTTALVLDGMEPFVVWG